MGMLDNLEVAWYSPEGAKPRSFVLALDGGGLISGLFSCLVCLGKSPRSLPLFSVCLKINNTRRIVPGML